MPFSEFSGLERRFRLLTIFCRRKWELARWVALIVTTVYSLLPFFYKFWLHSLNLPLNCIFCTVCSTYAISGCHSFVFWPSLFYLEYPNFIKKKKNPTYFSGFIIDLLLYLWYNPGTFKILLWVHLHSILFWLWEELLISGLRYHSAHREQRLLFLCMQHKLNYLNLGRIYGNEWPE